MPFFHNQTTPMPIPSPVATNWTVAGSNNTSRVAQVSTTTTPLNPQVGSFVWSQFDGGNVTYTNPISANWSEFTIEGWCAAFESSTLPTLKSFASRIYVGNGFQFEVSVIPNAPTDQYQLGFIYRTPTQSYGIGPSSIFQSVNTWTYFTLVKRSDNTAWAMLNGVRVGSISNVSAYWNGFTTATGTAMQVGGDRIQTPSLVTQVVWDQIRVSNVARYSPDETFTPPTTAFANDANTWYLSAVENTFQPAPSPT